MRKNEENGITTKATHTARTLSKLHPLGHQCVTDNDHFMDICFNKLCGMFHFIK